MRKIKARQKTKNQLAADHVSLVVDAEKTISELDRKKQSLIYGRFGSIRKLMAVHNALLDQREGQSEANADAIKRAASVLNAAIDQKLDAVNQLLEESFNAVSKKKREKVRKPNRRATTKRRAKRDRARKAK